MQDEFDSLMPQQRFDRRDFLATALGASFALAVQPVAAQSMIETSAEGLLAGTISVPVADGNMPVYRAQPAYPSRAHRKPLPVIVVIPEIFGVHAHIADVARRFARLGYLALAPDLFARQGDPGKYASIPDIRVNIIDKVSDAQVKADLDALLAWAECNGGDKKRIGITGFCWGGRIVWLYANHNPNIRAGVAWYGRLRGDVALNTPRHPLDIADNLRAPVLGLYGGQDQGIPQSDVEAMQAKLCAAGGGRSKSSEIIVYPDAPHAFHADYRPSYRAAEAADGWQRARDWFHRHGV